MNKALIIGNLGADAELKVLGSGDAVANFSVATTEKWTDKEGNKQEKTEWHRCALWGKRATALVQYLTKGTKVAVEGKIETRSYEKDGEKRYATGIKVTDVELLGGGKRQAADDEDSLPPDSGSIDSLPSDTAGENEIPF